MVYVCCLISNMVCKMYRCFVVHDKWCKKVDKDIVEFISHFVFVCLLRQRAEESSGWPVPVPVPCGQKHLSVAQVAGLHQASEPTTPQKRTADRATSAKVCQSCT